MCVIALLISSDEFHVMKSRVLEPQNPLGQVKKRICALPTRTVELLAPARLNARRDPNYSFIRPALPFALRHQWSIAGIRNLYAGFMLAQDSLICSSVNRLAFLSPQKRWTHFWRTFRGSGDKCTKCIPRSKRVAMQKHSYFSAEIPAGLNIKSQSLWAYMAPGSSAFKAWWFMSFIQTRAPFFTKCASD